MWGLPDFLQAKFLNPFFGKKPIIVYQNFTFLAVDGITVGFFIGEFPSSKLGSIVLKPHSNFHKIDKDRFFFIQMKSGNLSSL